MSKECSCEVCGKHHLHKYNERKDYCSVCNEVFDKDIKELILKCISTFNLERLVNIINYNSGMCFTCKNYIWKTDFPENRASKWICIEDYDLHFTNCHGEKFKPDKYFLEKIKI